MNVKIRYAAAVLALLAPWCAHASEGYITDDLTLYAGPDDDYPEVAYVPAGTLVEIYGCVENYAWCDVGIDEDRGWVSGDYLQFAHQEHWGYVREYGPRYGLPIVAFTLGSYWGSHYSHYGWYDDRHDWAHSKHGYRPHGQWQTHYVPVHHYGNDRRLPEHYYGNVHHSNSYWNESHHGGGHYDKAAADLANRRTAEFFTKHLG